MEILNNAPPPIPSTPLRSPPPLRRVKGTILSDDFALSKALHRLPPI